MKLLVWNIQWAKSRARLEAITSVVRDESPNIMCFTEVIPFLSVNESRTIASTGDYGYANPGNRHKVWMWSDTDWEDIDCIGSADLPPGRFVSGITHGVRMIGVCIPWAEAHVSSGYKNRKKWEDHRAYLTALKNILAYYVSGEYPVCIVGDFNQRVPPTPRNRDVYSQLIETLSPQLTIHTSEILDIDGKQLIDHVATTNRLNFTLSKTFSRQSPNGMHISDHPGLIGTISNTAETQRK
jgi:endonuclease/exonuclease/phosphatase family metal-dependent hydrolase